MKLFGQAVLSSLVAMFALTAAPACTENDVSIFIRNVQAPPTNRQNNSCVYTPDPTAPFLVEGTLDVAVTDQYIVFMLAGSQLRDRGDPQETRAESNRTHINGAVVRLTDANGGTLREFTALTSGFLDVASNSQPGYGVVGVTAIDGPSIGSVGAPAGGPAKLVVANIKIFGKTLGGVDVESGEFQFPIRVCNGCLISFAGGDDPATDGLDCNLPLNTSGGGGAGGGTQTQLPCFKGQDEATPCQLCADKPACRGAAP